MFRGKDIESYDVALSKKVMVFTLTGEKTLLLRCYTSDIPSSTEVQAPVYGAFDRVARSQRGDDGWRVGVPADRGRAKNWIHDPEKLRGY